MDLVSGVTHMENRLEKRRTGQEKSSLRHRTHEQAEGDAGRHGADNLEQVGEDLIRHVDTTA